MFGHPEWNIEHFWNNSKRRLTQALSPSNSREASPEPDETAESTDDDNADDNEISQPIEILDGEPSNKRRRSS